MRRVWGSATAASPEVAHGMEGNESPLPALYADAKQFVFAVADGSFRRSCQETPLSAISFCPDVEHRPIQSLSLNVIPPQVSIDAETGWVMCNESDYLFWLPPEQAKYLCTPGCRLVIPTLSMVTLDMSRFVHGERWTECYQPD